MTEDTLSLWRIESRKYDGSLHRVWPKAIPLQTSPIYREDTLPYFSLLLPAHSPVIESSGEIWSSSYDVIACFFAGKYYQVMVLCKSIGTEYYCNSCSIASIDTQARLVSYIDMDLDVIIDHRRHVRIVDQDEYEQHAKKYRYPMPLQSKVQADLEKLVRQVRLQKGIFAKGYSWKIKKSDSPS